MKNIIIGILAVGIVTAGVALIVTNQQPQQDTFDFNMDSFLSESEGDQNSEERNFENSLLSEEEAISLVHDFYNIECGHSHDCDIYSVDISEDRGNQYLISITYTEYSDSVDQQKRLLLVQPDNLESWIPASIQPEPSILFSCHRGNADGSTGWTSGLCI